MFQRISSVRPTTLIIVADGPRDGDEESGRRCSAARKVVESVDWPCEVHRDYASKHLGLRTRLEAGFDFAFSIVERAIFIEDDCLPEPTFFRYVEELLDFYENDHRIACISGYKPPGVLVDGAS